ncbi:hypothetical protein B1808_14405 [Pseudofulvimonas gallinarii]|nr:hypothetical protein B1808_14405 [Pseudofulvimonas gallinarii]
MSLMAILACSSASACSWTSIGVRSPAWATSLSTCCCRRPIIAATSAYRKFKRPFRAVCWVGGGRASPVLGTDRTSVSGISASRGHAAALSAAMLR